MAGQNAHPESLPIIRVNACGDAGQLTGCAPSDYEQTIVLMVSVFTPDHILDP